MKASLALPLLLLAIACGRGGEESTSVVQAATKAAEEFGEQVAEKTSVLAQKAAEVAQAKSEEASGKVQELVDAAATELAAARDSETVQNAASEIDRALTKVAELLKTLGAKLDLQALRIALDELVTRFRNDPDVERALAALRAKLDTLGG